MIVASRVATRYVEEGEAPFTGANYSMKFMNVLCVEPFVSKALCDDAFMYIEVHKKGVRLAVISSKSAYSRGKWDLPNYINMGGVHVYRLYRNLDEMFILPRKGLKKSLKIAYALSPDLIFCSQERSMRLALLLQRSLDIPIVLRVEDASRIFTGKSYGSWKFRSVMRTLGIPPGGFKFWSWLCEKAEALITCNPMDQHILGVLSMHGKPVFYIPWPAHMPEHLEKQRRKENRGIYVGTLYPMKGVQVFERVIPNILKETPTEEFIIVGTGPFAATIKRLRQRFPDAIEYYPQLPRLEVLKLISSSYYGYSPSRPGMGYGFIADCWGVGTPILLNHNVCGSENVDAAVARDENDLLKIINRLYDTPRFYDRLQKIGYDEYKKRSAKVVAHKLYEIFERTLNR
jgi:glycosyltransferase involved in cell wall biosynthesis